MEKIIAVCLGNVFNFDQFNSEELLELVESIIKKYFVVKCNLKICNQQLSILLFIQHVQQADIGCSNTIVIIP